ncbi:DUF222 domain-containing protein [Aeromicrobium sp.]|uniref:HNH endonuclease signature motif containing protein n=1 Tax=Aeromicrobium sp. TaxID=1871063 RepID=UPI003C5260A2
MAQSPAQQVVTGLHALLDSLPLSAYEAMSTAEQVAVAEGLARVKARVAGHELACAQAMEVSRAAREHGATSTGALLAGAFGGDRREADRLVRTAETVGRASQTRDALADGRVSVKQAEVIARRLPEVPEEHRDAAEAQLLCDAERLDLKTLERRADRIAEVYAPEQVDEIENDLVAAREKAAWKKTTFWMVDSGDGTHKGGFVLPDAQADQLRVALDALTAPQHDLTSDDAVLDEKPTYGQRLGWAFCQLLDVIPGDRLPDTNGVGAILTVNLDYDVLCGKVAAATLSTGTRISAGEARRLACTNRLMPAVFGGDSLPMDVGRAKRCFTGHQRRALETRDRGCIFPGCDRPPGWCVVHHADERWADGGHTDLDEGVLICPAHHRILHADDWRVRFAGDGLPELVPPARLDPDRTPRRHARFSLAA